MENKPEPKPTPQPVTRQVQTIHKSQADLDEIDRYLSDTGQVAGKAYVTAMQIMINRDKKARRFS
jgi:hypothetical protein